MFELALPWALLLFPLPILIWYFIKRAPVSLSVALKVPFFYAISMLIRQEKPSSTISSNIIMLFISWCLLVFAFSGLKWVGAPIPLERESYNIMLALDISPSMEVNDMLYNGRHVTRLQVVKSAAEQFVEERRSDKIGLILFGERAYLISPLTFDHENLLMRIEDASPGLAGKSTSIGDALGLAIKRLQQVPAKGRTIILLTDGVNNSGVLAPLKAAEIAKSLGIKIYTIGLGSEIDPNSFDSMFMSMNGAADLDEDTLKKVANQTGGQYYRATNMQSLQNIYKQIDKMTRVKVNEATFRPQHEYYPWPLGLGLLLFTYALFLKGRFRW